MASLLENAFKFISPHENKVKQTYIAYPDGPGRMSIGFGNLSYAGEIIDYNEAVNRCKNYIQNDLVYLEKEDWFKNLNDFQKIAILDFAYQAGKYGLKFASLRSAVISKVIEKEDFRTGYEDSSRVENRWNMFQTISGTPVIQFASMDNFWILMIFMSAIAIIVKKYIS